MEVPVNYVARGFDEGKKINFVTEFYPFDADAADRSCSGEPREALSYVHRGPIEDALRVARSP